MNISDERSVLKEKLPKFLTMEKGIVSKLLIRRPHEEILGLYLALDEMKKTYPKWADSANLIISYDDWIVDKRTPFAGNKGRLRSILRQELKLNENETNTHEIKRKLHDLLDIGMSKNQKKLYALPHDIIRKVFFPYEKEKTPEYELFKQALIHIVRKLGDKIKETEEAWLSSHLDYDGRRIPADVLAKIEHQVLTEYSQIIDAEIAGCSSMLTDVLEVSDEGGCLLKMFSDNLVLNDLINEYEAINNRTREAQKIVLELLANLKEKDVLVVPKDFLSISNEEGSLLTKKYLELWFGPKGTLLSGEYFKASRPLYDAQIKLIIKWSQIAQNEYKRTKGIYSQEEHSQPENLFMFALGLVGAFYSKASTPKEHTGTSNARRSVFPSNPHQENPPPHVLAIMIEFYSQMYYGSQNYMFDCDNIVNYGNVSIAKRAKIQNFLFNIVKNRSPKELLSLRFYLAYDVSTSIYNAKFQ